MNILKDTWNTSSHLLGKSKTHNSNPKLQTQGANQTNVERVANRKWGQK